jgi:hypothetical protein
LAIPKIKEVMMLLLFSNMLYGYPRNSGLLEGILVFCRCRYFGEGGTGGKRLGPAAITTPALKPLTLVLKAVPLNAIAVVGIF